MVPSRISPFASVALGGGRKIAWSSTRALRYVAVNIWINDAASRVACGVSAMANASQSMSARAPMIGFSFLQRALSCSSSMGEENGLGFGAFVTIPDVKQVAHHIDEIAPAFHVLLASLAFQGE